jgi:hypothetical protein
MLTADTPTTLRYARTVNGADGAWRDATYANPLTHYPRPRAGWLWSIAVAAIGCAVLGVML